VHRLGGSAVTVGPSDLQLGRGETIEDTARTISHFARAFVIRTYSDDDVTRFAQASTIPVINALTNGHHPCQALADLLTLRERFGSLRDVRIAYVGDGNNVAHSLMESIALAGGHITLGCPADHLPDADVACRAKEIASETGATVRVVSDPRDAVRRAEAVYTDVWLSMGDADVEREARLMALAPYQVNEHLLEDAAPGAIFMHCLPAHRGEEVTTEVVDGPRSVIFDQVENRAHTEQAVLLALLERRLQGAKS
jgi:ornithine carbamoyltransferase